MKWNVRFTLVKMTINKKSANSKCWKRCREKGTLLCCWWECKLIQPLWKTVWNCLKNTKNRTAVWPSNPKPGHMPSSVQFSSVVQSCPTCCDSMNGSTPVFPVHHQTQSCWNQCPSSWWCHPTISFSVVPFSYLQSFPAWGSFPMSHFFASGSQRFGVSASAPVLPINIQNWFPLGFNAPRNSQESSPTPQFKSVNSLVLSVLYSTAVTVTTFQWILEKP